MDRGAFFLALGGLAAGGVGGYVVRDQNLISHDTPVQTAPAMTVAPTPVAATTPTVPTPVCDDSTGSPGACPPLPYSAEEGGCSPVANKRCEDFKASLKPRVAERAVACLTSLTPAQKCDANRVNLCGHEALMSACAEPETAQTGANATPDDLTTRCQQIAQSCSASTTSGPSVRECRATLAGMTAVGRDRTAECMRTHCGDKGLIGCEALSEAK
jgi:hypothetical protein